MRAPLCQRSGNGLIKLHGWPKKRNVVTTPDWLVITDTRRLRTMKINALNNPLFTRRAGMQCCQYDENYNVTPQSDVTRKKFL